MSEEYKNELELCGSDWVLVADVEPKQPIGTHKDYWVCYKSHRDGVLRVTQATNWNAPFTGEEEVEPVWAMYSEDGDPFNAVGWHEQFSHPEYESYYKPFEYGEILAYRPVIVPPVPAALRGLEQ